MDEPHCIDCKFFVDNGVAHCTNPRVGRAVELLMGKHPVHEMQLHFIRFSEYFCGIDARWFESKRDDDDDDED